MAATVTAEALREHGRREDLWIAVHGHVYDVTAFLEEHPGGPEILLEQAGTDATVAFDDIGHTDYARDLLENYRIGTLAGAATEAGAEAGTDASTDTAAETGRDPKMQNGVQPDRRHAPPPAASAIL